MKAEIDTECEISVTEARVSPWTELAWPVEWAQLRLSPVYQGLGIPRGHGEPVIVVPGFLGSDLYTTEMRRWLTRIGYAAHVSGIGRNSDCPDVSLAKLEETVAAVVESSGRRVRLVGHSLGGLLARAAAVHQPKLVSHVITLGAPIRGVMAHPAVVRLAQVVGRLTVPPSTAPREHDGHLHDGACSCDLAEALASVFPESVVRTSVYSRRDGIVDWRACLDTAPGRNVEVVSSHLGMLANMNVYGAVGSALVADAPAVPAETGASAA